MRRNILWCVCRKICSNSWKMKLPCLRDIGRVLPILCLQTSVFNTAVHDILLYYDRVSFKHSLILKACLTLGLFSSAKTAQRSPNCSCNTWPRESFVTELGQNWQTFLQRSGCTYPASHRNNLAVISYCFPSENLRDFTKVCRTVTMCPRGCETNESPFQAPIQITHPKSFPNYTIQTTNETRLKEKQNWRIYNPSTLLDETNLSENTEKDRGN